MYNASRDRHLFWNTKFFFYSLDWFSAHSDLMRSLMDDMYQAWTAEFGTFVIPRTCIFTGHELGKGTWELEKDLTWVIRKITVCPTACDILVAA